MSKETSRHVINLVESGDVASGELATILSQYFRENRDVIWQDALEKHNLLID